MRYQVIVYGHDYGAVGTFFAASVRFSLAPALYSALILIASRVTAFSVAPLTGMLSPPSRSWINHVPDASFLAFGTFT